MKSTVKTYQKRYWEPIRILSIAGSDSGGGAGLQADIKTISSLGGYSATAVSAITVQNTLGVESVYPVCAKQVCEQVDAVCRDLKPQAIKISMLPDPETAEPLAELLKKHQCTNIVIDPVMVATSGHSLSDMPAIENMLRYLFPLARIVTPNLSEAQQITGIELSHIGKCQDAAAKILEWGPQAVLIKGGHAKGAYIKDLLLSAKQGPIVFKSPRIKTNNLHGTGCTLSAAIAFFLASGLDINHAVLKAKEYLHTAIKAGSAMALGSGHGPVNHSFDPVPLIRIPKNQK